MQLNASKIKAIVIALVYLSALVYLAQASARLGLSQYLNFRADVEKDGEKIKSAIEFYKSNPSAYQTQAFLTLRADDYPSAIESLQQAINLQPNNYILWLRLGEAFYQSENFEDARFSYQKTINLAPHYAQPKWNMGQLLFKLGKTEEAFAYLREAAKIDSAFFPSFLNAALKNFPADAEAIERVVAPDNIELKKQLAHFFIQHKLPISDNTKKFLLNDELSNTEKNEFISKLILDGDFDLARLVWQSAYGKSNNDSNKFKSLIVNGDFESEINSSEIGFSWQPSTQNSSFLLSLDGENPFSNRSSLQITFNGNHSLSEPFISQLALTNPGDAYQLSFAARTEKLTSGGLPTVIIKDAKTNELLGKSAPLSEKLSKWEVFKIRFNAGNKTAAIRIEVSRENCSNSCPIFGELWLDDFQLKTVSK